MLPSYAHGATKQDGWSSWDDTHVVKGPTSRHGANNPVVASMPSAFVLNGAVSAITVAQASTDLADCIGRLGVCLNEL